MKLRRKAFYKDCDDGSAFKGAGDIALRERI